MQKKIFTSRVNVFKRLFALQSKIIITFILIISILFGPTILSYSSDEKPFVPWDYNRISAQNELISIQKADTSLGGSFLINAVRFYQNYISPVKEARCPMNPSCSAYSIQAIKKHGFFLGIMMTADRLIHEGDEIHYATAIIKDKSVRFYDPVNNNDFWFNKDKSK
jgi:Uncharacterized conserved protein